MSESPSTRLRGVAATLEAGLISPKLIADLAAELRVVADAVDARETLFGGLAAEARGLVAQLDRCSSISVYVPPHYADSLRTAVARIGGRKEG